LEQKGRQGAFLLVAEFVLEELEEHKFVLVVGVEVQPKISHSEGKSKKDIFWSLQPRSYDQLEKDHRLIISRELNFEFQLHNQSTLVIQVGNLDEEGGQGEERRQLKWKF